MKHLGLFEGIGGFSLAARWMGWETVAWIEKDPYCQKVLNKNFPNAKGYGDIKEFNGTEYRGTIDVLSGGFPCQPYSQAGKREGTNDDRHLWPEMLRVIREVQPINIVGENVFGIVNWSDGLVFEQVQTDLENEGYEVQAFIIPAYAVNAQHRRDRVWIIANTKCQGLQRHKPEWQKVRINQNKTFPINSDGYVFNGGERFEGYSKYIRGCDGVSRRLDKHRVKALGNAIVPQVALKIFKAIESTIL